MTTSDPATKTVSLDDASQQLEQLVNEVATGKTRIMIERDGEPVALLESAVSAKQREINAMLAEPRFRELASVGLAFKDTPLDKLDREVSQALDEGRKKRQEDRRRGQ